MHHADSPIDRLNAAYGTVVAAHNGIDIPDHDVATIRDISFFMQEALRLRLEAKDGDTLSSTIGELRTIGGLLRAHPSYHAPAAQPDLTVVNIESLQPEIDRILTGIESDDLAA